MILDGQPLVKSIKEKCRVCYTCVRECPAKAIRILNGQADVMAERCIGCGNCVLVCSQSAKEVFSSINIVKQLFDNKENVAAIVAPSFPVECEGFGYKKYIGMIRALGFKKVVEVAVGADLVAREYGKLLSNNPGKSYISSPCPAIVAYIEYYCPQLIDKLAPIVSPMIATARYLKKIDTSLKVVFIGPCLAKKAERRIEELAGDVDAVLTFVELNKFFKELDIVPGKVEPSFFDPPHADMGKLFPLTRGLLEAASVKEDLVDGNIISTEGRRNFIDALKGMEKDAFKVKLLDLLCCQGCIMGAGCSVNNREEMFLFHRRQLVSKYAREAFGEGKELFDENVAGSLNLYRSFQDRDQRLSVPSLDQIKQVLKNMGKEKPEDELNCGACGYETCLEHAIAVLKGFAENQMCLPYAIDQLKEMVQQIESSNKKVLSIQESLIQSEKLANIGQLAAGVAHEVNNPLGSVLLYAHLLLEKVQKAGTVDNNRIKEDLKIIVEQSDRCKKIISGLLDFARQNKVVRQNENVYELACKTLKTLNLPKDIETFVVRKTDDVSAELDRDQVSQALINLFTNAQAAMPEGGRLCVYIDGNQDFIEISVEDTGVGIPQDNISKIFDPFFTTKQIGMGTGLGLAVLYGIVKMHFGEVKVVSNTDASKGQTGTVFTLIFPRKEHNINKTNEEAI